MRVKSLEGELLRYKESSESYSQKIQALSMEIERVSKALREKDCQLQIESKNCNEVGAQLIKVSAELERCMNGWGAQEQEFWALNDKYHKLERSMGSWEIERKNLLVSVQDWETKAKNYKAEMERLQSTASSHEARLYEMQQYISIHSDCGEKIEILSSEVDRLTLENRSVKEDLEKIRLRFSETLHIEKRHEEFCLSFVLMSAEMEQMRNRMSEKEAEVENMRRSMLASARTHTNHSHTTYIATTTSSIFPHNQ
jgi:chromosome segregation ATPase